MRRMQSHSPRKGRKITILFDCLQPSVVDDHPHILPSVHPSSSLLGKCAVYYNAFAGYFNAGSHCLTKGIFFFSLSYAIGFMGEGIKRYCYVYTFSTSRSHLKHVIPNSFFPNAHCLVCSCLELAFVCLPTSAERTTA